MHHLPAFEGVPVRPVIHDTWFFGHTVFPPERDLIHLHRAYSTQIGRDGTRGGTCSGDCSNLRYPAYFSPSIGPDDRAYLHGSAVADGYCTGWGPRGQNHKSNPSVFP